VQAPDQGIDKASETQAQYQPNNIYHFPMVPKKWAIEKAALARAAFERLV
jgi:hypothetical protein